MNGFGSPLESFLDPGEKLLWSGQPQQGVRLQAGDIFLIPFSLMWGGFAIFWEATVLGLTGINSHPKHPVGSAGGIPIFMALWGIPFVVVGLYMIFGRFFYDSALRKKTWYGVTDRRLIIAKSLFNQTVNSFDFGTLTNLNLVERGDQSGDILFGTPGLLPGFANSSWPRSNRNAVVPGFYLLPDARQVFSRIQAARQSVKP
jgi:hypothetical protein